MKTNDGDCCGSGTPGPQGPAGVQGPTGLTGPTGPQGVAGPQGLTGLVGAMGAMGLTGATGPQGLTGNNGNNGTNGAAATIAVGSVTSLPAGSTPTIVNAGTTGDAVFNFGLVTGNTGATGPAGITTLEIQATMWHDETKVVSGGSLVIALATSYYYNMIVSQSPGGLADSFSQTFTIQAGTYTMYVMGYAGPSRGQVTWSIDGVTQGVQDWYNASGGETISTLAVTIVGNSVHTLLGTITGKNASSSGYLLPLNKYWIR